MGKEWLFRGGGGGRSKSTKKGKSSAAGGGGGVARGGRHGEREEPTGCMCAVLQLFDLHHLPFPLHNQPSFRPGSPLLQDEPTICKGLEAPRNSLELEEPTKELTAGRHDPSASSSMKRQQNLNIPVNIQIRTSCENRSSSPRASTSSSKAARTDHDLLSECSSSSAADGPKTPTLLARLMGLDQLPPQAVQTSTAAASSPSTSTHLLPTNTHMHPPAQGRRHSTHHTREQSQSQSHSLLSRRHLQSRSCSAHMTTSTAFLETHHDNAVASSSTGTISLPETPRISSSSRKSDVEHRLSLQLINKENNIPMQHGTPTDLHDFEFSASTAKKLARRIAESTREDVNCRRASGSTTSHYARQMVKQVKERVSRSKVGLVDITNTTDLVKTHSRRRDDDDDPHVVLLKPNKPPSSNIDENVLLVAIAHGCSQSKQQNSTSSCSPRLSESYNLTNKNKPSVVYSCSDAAANQSGQSSPSSSPLSKPKPFASSEVRKWKEDLKVASEKYRSRLKKTPQVPDGIRNKKEGLSFIRSGTTINYKANITDKKCKKTPLSHDLLNITTAVPTLLPVKKDIPFPPTNSLCDPQAQKASGDGETWRRNKQKVSSCLSHSYGRYQQQQQQQKKEGTKHIQLTSVTTTTTTTTTTSFTQLLENINKGDDRCRNGSRRTNSPPSNSTSSSRGIFGDEALSSAVVLEHYKHYIRRILKRTGIDRSSPVSLAKWYSPSHPLDPSIFHYIELFLPIPPASTSASSSSELSLRSNRRLIYEVVDELLAEILKSYLRKKPGCSPQRGQTMYGWELIDTLCSRINKFPSANCQVLQDIDALIGGDLRGGRRESFEGGGAEEEGEEIVSEIEREIMESLVHETAMETCS